MFVILFLINILFLWYFFAINFIYWDYLVWFLFSIMIILALFSDTGQKSIKFFLKRFFLEYIMYINFLIIISWIYFIIKYFFQKYYNIWLITDINAIFTVLWFVILLYLFSCFFNKINILKVSYFWFLVIFSYMLYLVKDLVVFEYFISFIVSISVVWHLIYFIKNKRYSRFILYVLFLSSIVALFLLIKHIFKLSLNTLSLVVQLIVFVILLYNIYIEKKYNRYLSIKEEIEKRQHELSLFWFSDIKIDKEDEEYYENFDKNYYDIIIDFFLKAPDTVKIIFALTNSIPVVFATYVMFKTLWVGHNVYNEIIYWIQWIVFFINFLLFKYFNWFVFIQRIFAFFIVNFITYFTIIDFIWKNYLYISIWWMIWNLFTTLLMLFIWKKDKLLQAVDYLTWSFVNFLWVFLNIYFLLKIGLNVYLTYWIILLYLGLYLFLYRIIYRKYFL